MPLRLARLGAARLGRVDEFLGGELRARIGHALECSATSKRDTLTPYAEDT